MAWKVFGASARGTSHVAGGLPCQDAWHAKQVGDWLIAVVCDGAGSAASSHIGSTLVSHTVVDVLAGQVPALAADELAGFGARVTRVLGDVRATLAEHVTKSHADLYAYSSTVVGVAMGPRHGWFFHIGDGVGVARHAGDDTVSGPENGEYSNETFFLTGADWQAHLRVDAIAQPARSIVLMSDGAMPFAMDKGHHGLYAPFIDPIARFLATASEAEGSAALAATLDDPRTAAITSDDKTLLVALNG